MPSALTTLTSANTVLQIAVKANQLVGNQNAIIATYSNTAFMYATFAQKALYSNTAVIVANYPNFGYVANNYVTVTYANNAYLPKVNGVSANLTSTTNESLANHVTRKIYVDNTSTSLAIALG